MLTEFYAPTTSSARKQQLEQGLHSFRTLLNAHLSSLEIILAIVRASFCWYISARLMHRNPAAAAAAVLSNEPLTNAGQHCLTLRLLQLASCLGRT